MFNRDYRLFKGIALVLLLCFVMSFATVPASAATEDNNVKTTDDIYDADSNYSTYIKEYIDREYSSQSINITADSLISAENTVNAIVKDNGKSVLLGDANRFAEFTFNVDKAGLFNICLNYKSVKDTASDIRLNFQFDGKSPYDELGDVTFSKIWVNADEKIQKDDRGDELRPEQVEKYEYRTQWAENDLGLYNSPYFVYLAEGTHILKVSRVAESLEISKIVLEQYGKDIPEYESYISANSNVNKADNDYIIEAESAFQKSHSTLAATIDNTNAGMTPQSAQNKVVNSFGKNVWQENGQWASWTVPETVKDDMYVLRFRAKQDGNVGTTTYRKLYINGELPFKEASQVAFDYFNGWQIATFGEEKPYLIHLKAGDIITLEATTGPMAQPLSEIYASVNMLNDIYQSIIMVTGASPDLERDYNIQKEVPTLLDDIKTAREKVANIGRSISKVMGQNNPKVFFINKFLTVLDSYLENYRLIVPELATFKSYIESYAGETYDFNSLPLELDSIMLMSPESKPPKAEVNFWKSMMFEFKRFAASFTEDYAKTGNGANKRNSITVWCSLGRDQAQSVRQIIDNNFTPKSDIDVDFKISVTTLAEAILSGREPDVSISVTQEVPVDLAMRGQALDLTKYLETLPEEYMEQFPESAWIPFKYEDGIYAMPITQDFQMMFYRKDIFRKLGLSIPKTWDEFYVVLRELQRNNFQVGIRESDSANPGVSVAINLYETLLLQNGEQYFKNDLKEVNFESHGGKKAFAAWVKLYKDYDLDTDFDITSRFRSGEMPLVVTAYSYYQNLSTVAPDISGRWTIAPVPATIDGEGREHNTVSSSLTGTIILKGAEKRGNADAAFEFVKWWAGAEAQVKYSNAMESLQGIAGRPAVANKEAFKNIGWPEAEENLISAQRENVSAIPQVPGTYIINRSLTNALRKSYNESVDPLRQLSIQCRTINTELARKRAEFEKNN